MSGEERAEVQACKAANGAGMQAEQKPRQQKVMHAGGGAPVAQFMGDDMNLVVKLS